jgi:hypothetical protein
MLLAYNPIVRTFCRVRAVLTDTLGVDRRQVRPATPLATLIPPDRQGEVVSRLREAGLPAPPRERTLMEWPLCELTMAIPILLLVSCLIGSWVAFLITIPTAVLFGVAAFTVTRTRVVQVPFLPRTVGELVIYLLHFGDYPGYRFSRNEVSLKVRFVIAEGRAEPLDTVREDSSFIDLGS